MTNTVQRPWNYTSPKKERKVGDPKKNGENLINRYEQAIESWMFRHFFRRPGLCIGGCAGPGIHQFTVARCRENISWSTKKAWSGCSKLKQMADLIWLLICMTLWLLWWYYDCLSMPIVSLTLIDDLGSRWFRRCPGRGWTAKEVPLGRRETLWK